MGLGGGLVKVFCKGNSSIGNERNLCLDKSRWTSVRLYLCGDDMNSVAVENDSASIRSSQASVVQPLQENSVDKETVQVAGVDEYEEFIATVEENPPIKFSHEEEAAILIQSAFRGFMARQWYEDIKKSRNDDDKGVEDLIGVNEAASIEVLVDDSTECFSLCNENGAIQHRVLPKSRSQFYRLKEEWDDSTLSSDTLRLRIQNKLEATTRRERALAYAFSQQLRTCMTKKKPNGSYSTNDSNTGWSWLERWMATRVPENSFHIDRRLPMLLKNRLDMSIEAKESCGSNDVPVIFEGATLPSESPKDAYGQVKNKFKAARSVSRRKTMPEYHRPLGSTKVNKKFNSKEQESNREKQVQPRSMGDPRSKDAPQALQ